MSEQEREIKLAGRRFQRRGHEWEYWSDGIDGETALESSEPGWYPTRALGSKHWEIDDALNQLAALRERVRALEEALREVAEGKGRFSMDPFEHAQNTIDDMKEIALDALSTGKPPEEWED